jgi:serine protease Do
MEDDKGTVKNPEGQASYKAVRRRSLSKIGKYTAIIFLLLVGCFAAGLGGGYLSSRLGLEPTVIDRNSTKDGNTLVSKEEEDISAVASKVSSSVVSIITKGQTTDSLFGAQSVEGAGTGIIVSKDGYILTNKHVVSGANQLTVITNDGTVYTNVRVVGTDPLNDLAFVKINKVDNLQPATLGDSSSARIGQKVVAIGNSLGEYKNTVTFGIISGTGRPISAQDGHSNYETLSDLLQTDAAINPGNSGGPLTNLSGQVIGINTAVAENAQSMGFSIPINSAKGILKNLLKTGKVQRAYLGINYISIVPEIVKKFNLPVKKGAYVLSESGSSVIAGSPAAKAGIKEKDIVLKVGDLDVGENGSVATLISEYAVGDNVQLTILRGGKTMTITVALQAYVQA